eukprot:CAMPEP_0197547510 /NCGR_PEP_ID=MMETSP1320-20131121/1852_1 /TAXON_ID=91990 /ORGANISM="Bolidomonas sp., Strain RCC2347" /LENGTH=429 /DNA_ID=CAMNT_0043107329 /DNA_START=255 /DNA_END=1541 /DNA_ORIENTATION=-
MSSSLTNLVVSPTNYTTSSPPPPSPPPPPPTHVILFYKYTPLPLSKASLHEKYAPLFAKYCTGARMRGRLLIGASKNEGLNGTFSGSYAALQLFTASMAVPIGEEKEEEAIKRFVEGNADRGCIDESLFEAYLPLALSFRDGLRAFHASHPDVPSFTIPKEEFKWSENETGAEVFPDLHVKVVKEIVSTGGKLESIPISATSKGYLTPSEFHSAVAAHSSSPSPSTLLIDCRNSKEVAIGTFANSLNPNTKTFHEFPTWVDKNASKLTSCSQILMFCTGGVRCEKASAYVRSRLPSGGPTVHHLRGGVHKYLEEYGGGGHFKGKNFVFDSRQGMAPKGGGVKTVGKCAYCEAPWDTFAPGQVCTVCREQVLVCEACDGRLREYHCGDHMDLKEIYFTDLSSFSLSALEGQRSGLVRYLEGIAVGKAYKS